MLSFCPEAKSIFLVFERQTLCTGSWSKSISGHFTVRIFTSFSAMFVTFSQYAPDETAVGVSSCSTVGLYPQWVNTGYQGAAGGLAWHNPAVSLIWAERRGKMGKNQAGFDLPLPCLRAWRLERQDVEFGVRPSRPPAAEKGLGLVLRPCANWDVGAVRICLDEYWKGRLCGKRGADDRPWTRSWNSLVLQSLKLLWLNSEPSLVCYSTTVISPWIWG